MFAVNKHEFLSEGQVKISQVDPTDGGVPKTIYYLQKITGFKNFCLVFDENTKEFPQARDYIRVKGQHIITSVSDIVKVESWEAVPFPSTQEQFPTVAQASRKMCHCSHH